MSSPTFAVVIPQGSKAEFQRTPPEVLLEDLANYVLTAEELGFRAAWVYDHFLSWPADQADPVLEAWIVLSTLASQTSALRLGTMVTCVGYRNPGLLAKMAATFDVLTRGRLDLGLGAGWYEDEYVAYGYEFESDGRRAKRLWETVELVLELWRGQPVDYQGALTKTESARCLPRPLQQPHPPVWIGGAGERVVLQVAARYAQGWNMTGPTIAEFTRKGEVLSSWCHRVGRDSNDVQRSVEQDCLLVDQPKDVKRLLGQHAERIGLPESEVAQRHLVGTPERVAARISEYMEAGAEYFVLWFPDSPRTQTLEVFAETVVPLFR